MQINFHSLLRLYLPRVPIFLAMTVSIEDVESTLASLRASANESKADSVECPHLKPDWLLSMRLFCVRKAVIVL